MRLIDAEALMYAIDELPAKVISPKFNDPCFCTVLETNVVLDAIRKAPTIEAKPVVHAHWDEVSGGRIICSHCGEYPLYDYWGRIKLSRCCHTCGAQMDESISRGHENDNHIADPGKKEE